MTNQMSVEEVMGFYRVVEATPTPASKGVPMRHQTRKEIARAIRALFKEVGIKGVSVTAPSYALAQAVHIRMPRPKVYHDCTAGRMALGPERQRDCEFCRLHWAADKGIERIILGAYPDLDNRSDAMIDWFDYKLSIG